MASSSKAAADSKIAADSKTAAGSSAAAPEKSDLDTPPPYHPTTDPGYCSSGLIDFAHLSTLTPEQLAKFDEELVTLCKRWTALRDHGMPMQEFRNWLREYGFFVSMSRTKYRHRAAEEGRELGARLADMVAYSGSTVEGDGVPRLIEFWTTVRELVEVRGLAGRV